MSLGDYAFVVQLSFFYRSKLVSELASNVKRRMFLLNQSVDGHGKLLVPTHLSQEVKSIRTHYNLGGSKKVNLEKDFIEERAQTSFLYEEEQLYGSQTILAAQIKDPKDQL